MQMLRWTKEDDEFLTRNYATRNKDMLIKRLSRTWSAINIRASKLGVKVDRSGVLRRRKWTNDEEQKLKDNYADMSKSDLLIMFNKNWSSIVSKAHKIGVSKRYKWSKQNEKYLIKNYSSGNKDKLVKRFGISWDKIKAKARRTGIKIDRTNANYNRPWTPKEEEYLRSEYKFGNISDIAKSLNRTKKSISERAKILNLKRDSETARKQSCVYAINDYFFSEWNNDMAYVLGLMCTDGNVSKSSNCISICLHIKDKYLLEDVLEKMNSTHKVVVCKNTSNLSIHNKHMHSDLIKLGITPNKSKTLKCPRVPYDFIPHFVRGAMDGDGSVSSKLKRMKIVSASKDFAYGVAELLDKINVAHKIYNCPYVWKSKKTDFYSVVVLRKNDISNLYGLMYKDASLFLKRKKQRFVDMDLFLS